MAARIVRASHAFRRRPRGHQALGAAVAVALLGGIAIAVAVTRPPGVFEQAYRIPVVDGPRHDQHIRLDATLFVPVVNPDTGNCD